MSGDENAGYWRFEGFRIHRIEYIRFTETAKSLSGSNVAFAFRTSEYSRAIPGAWNFLTTRRLLRVDSSVIPTDSLIRIV